MKIIITIGLRNVWRNTRRSLMTIAVVAISLGTLILADGFNLGAHKAILKTQTNFWLGEAQIHHPKYRSDPLIEQTIPNLNKIISLLEKEPKLAHYSTRLISTATAQSAQESAVVKLVGLDFDKEEKISHLSRYLIKGKSPLDKDKKNLAFVGKRLSKRLDLSPGDKLVITLSKAHSNKITQALFRVGGILAIPQRFLDETLVLTQKKDIEAFLNLKAKAHEVSISFHEELKSVEFQKLSHKISTQQASLESWSTLIPSLKAIIEMSAYSNMFIAGLLFFFIFFTVMNTLFMSIFERRHEFSVLKSLGTRSEQMSLMIFSECAGLAIIGSLFGVLLGVSLQFLFNINGVTYSEFELSGMNMTEPIYTVFRLQQVSIFPFIIISMVLLSACYPAWWTAKNFRSGDLK